MYKKYFYFRCRYLGTLPETTDYIVLAECCLHNMLHGNKVITSFEKNVMVTSK